MNNEDPTVLIGTADGLWFIYEMRGVVSWVQRSGIQDAMTFPRNSSERWLEGMKRVTGRDDLVVTWIDLSGDDA